MRELVAAAAAAAARCCRCCYDLHFRRAPKIFALVRVVCAFCGCPLMLVQRQIRALAGLSTMTAMIVDWRLRAVASATSVVVYSRV